MRLIKYLFLLIMLFIVASASSQYTTKHYIAPSPWSYFSRYNELVITTLSTTPVAVTIANSSGTVYTNSATTVVGAPLRYRFPATDASANLSGVVLSGQGLYVSASVPVGVQVRNIASDNYTYSGLGPGDLTSCVQKGNSAFTSLGDQGLGTSFRLGYYANVTGQTCYSAETGAPLYSVLAISNNTSVYVNGILLKTLQAGQSYLFQANIGSLVTSNNNIVVNTGMRGDNSSGCADGVESQVIPTNNLGTTYVVVRSKGNTGYEKTTIVATQALTTVTVRVPSTNATTTYTLANAGDYVTINNGDGSNAYTTNYITTTAPVAVYTGSADGCEIDMIVQPPLSSCSGSFDVQTNQFLSNANDGNSALPYFGYIVIQSDTAIVWFNGTNLESIVGNRTQIGTTGYYIIKYTSTQLGNPSNLRFVVNARINAALIESGAGYSMSAFISSISNAMPPPSASSSCLPMTFTAQGGFSSYQWYKDGVLISGATSQTYSPSVAGSYSVAGTTASCGTTAQSTSVLVNPKPNAGSDFVACANQVDTLTATSTISGGSWLALPTNPAGATLSNTTNNVSTVSFSTTAGGTYQFAFSVGCSDTLTATINPLPTIAAITGTTSVCIGNTTTLSNVTTGGVWSSATPSVATINSNGLVTAVGVGTSVISYTVTNANGCTNTVTTTVTVNALPTVAAITGTTSVCVGASTTLSNSTTGGVWSSATPSVATVNASGVVTGVSAGTSVISYTVTNANGCVTTVTTTVTVNALPTVAAITGTTSVCVGASTTLSNSTTGGVWSSATPSVATVNASGVVTGLNNGTSVITYTVTNTNGCVTSVNATVTVNALPSVASISGTNSICAGTTTTFSNTTAGGVWSSGTTSVATINVSGVITGISAGNSVITYTYTNANGCSNSTTRTVTVNAQPVVAAITGSNSTCLGSGTVTLSNATSGGSWTNSSTSVATVSSAGVVTSVAAGTTTISYTVNGSGGCSTTQTLLFTVKTTSASTTNASICAGGSYTFNGTVYTTAGTYTKTLVNAVGCDSVATLNLTIKATSASTTNTSICPSALPYSWNGLTLSAAGTYTKTLVNAVGCDSVATLVLTVKATSASTTNASICAGGSYTFNGTVYTTAGTYTKTLVNAVGCDSVATLVLTVKATSASTTNASICAGGSYTFNGTVYTTAGTYTKTLVNAVGCDSIATLNLTVKATSASTTNTSICPSALPYNWNGLTINAAGTYTKTLVNAVGCDSIATLNLTVKATSASTTNTSICPSALPYSWNGLTINEAGTYTKTLVNAVGCDSIATLNLTVKATSTSTTNTSICPSALPYTWNGLTLNAAGTYTKTLVNAVGCDSVATLKLTVKATSASTTNASICPSALPYKWNGLTFSAAGTQTAHLTNYVGCDSAATLNLTVTVTSASTTTAILCAGNSYTFNGVTYNSPGTYVAHLTNYVGCDSTATLVLVGGAATASTTTMSICPSALPYVWNGLTFTGAGSKTAHLTNASGCDSAATLVLTVKAALTSTTNATICGGNSYLFNGVTFTTSGTYNAYLASGLGCDSIATLVLTVLPKPNAGVDKIVGYNNGNASVTLSGVGAGVWLANTTNTGSSVIVDPTSATTAITTFSTIGTYEYLYINGACSDTMKVSVLPNGNISSYVWVDTNEDGINNESTTNGINNVVIELYKEDANGSYVLVQTTTTATYNGKPGYYNFVIPENGNYKVKFPLVAQDGALSPQNLSTNTNNNSVADPVTGFSPVIAINTTGSGLSLNNTTVGAGYKYVASPNCNMTATIGVNQLSQCVTNNQYQFTGNFNGGTAPFTYLWDLNDGNYANTKDVAHTYATAGEHDVTFIVKDSRGCEAHASTVQIYIGAKPKASFDIYTHSGNGDGFTFVSTSTISGGWMNYSWNLGNGTTSTLINPMTTYSPGTYTVTLVVTGNFGCSDTITKVITIDSSNNYCSGPLANFSVNNIAQCLSGNSFVFTNTSTGNNNTYTWNLGDGTAASSNLNEQHTFTNTGTYNVVLTATNACGTHTVTKTITVNGVSATPSAITGPSTVALGGVIGLSNATTGGVWSSSNTAVATINNYGIVTGITAGNTVITYTVANTCGTTSVSMPITVLAANSNCIAPLANFTINTNTQCLVGNNFIFSNSASGTLLTYNWKFGDGATGNSANASHSFTQAGVYNVKLIVSNTCGTDSITKTITVNAAPNQPQAIIGNNSIATGGTTLLSTTTTGGVWSSSNTAIATVSANGLVTGVASGSATITYTVTNTCGSASVSKIILVSQPCVSTSSTTTASICAGNSYSFNGTTYNTAGTYTVRLTNSVGCDSIATLVLTVNSLPTQPQSITGNASAIVGNTSQLASITSGGIWSSSNTSVATINASGLVTAVSVGNIIISYTVSNGCGSANVTLNFSVIAAPSNGCNSLNASFSVNNTSQCITDNRFVFTNTTIGGTAPYTYLWEISEDKKYSTKDVTVTFSKYGDAEAKLKVIDSRGCESESDGVKLLIGARPVANFSVLNNTGSGQSKTFISASTITSGNLSYLWDFGNGLTSTQVNPTITYARGTYTAKLVVSGVGTCKDSVSQVINEVGLVSVSVYPNPVINTVQVNCTSASTSQTLVKLVDLNGRIIQTQTFVAAYIGANINASFDVRNLQPGSYFIQVSDSENGLLSNKVILKQ